MLGVMDREEWQSDNSGSRKVNAGQGNIVAFWEREPKGSGIREGRNMEGTPGKEMDN